MKILNLSTATKFGVTFGAIISLQVVNLIAASSALSNISNTTTELVEARIPLLEASLRIPYNIQTIRKDLRDGLQEKDSAGIAKWQKDYLEAEKAMDDDATMLVAKAPTPLGVQLGKKVQETSKVWKPIRDQARDLARDGKIDEAREVVYGKAYASAAQALIDAAKACADRQQEQARAGGSSIGALGRSTRTMMTLLSALAALVALAAGWLLARFFVSSLKQLSDRLVSLRDNCATNLSAGMEAMAGGDLTMSITPETTPLEVRSTDEVGRMSKTFNEALERIQKSIESYNQARVSLNELVGKIADNAHSVSSTSQTLAAAAEESTASSAEISSGSQRLATSASNSAATMTQLGRRVEDVRKSSDSQSNLLQQISQSVMESNAAIQTVTSSATTMATTADEGNRAVSETVAAMGRVKLEVERSTERVKELDLHGQEIGKIVETIEQIAQQTNLLALNAAIEAARAGDHGRGFAVVADEVRKLAEQSSSSAQQIAELIATVRRTVSETVRAIDNAQTEVVEGSRKSEAAGKSLNEILQAAKAVLAQNETVFNLSGSIAKTMSEVAEAANENQTAATEMMRGSQDVHESIETVAAISQESAAGAEQLTSSIEEVGSAATELARMSQDLQSMVATFKLDDEAKKPSKAKLRIAA